MRRAWLTVLRKEVVENARDRRTILTALAFGPLIGPVLFAIVLAFTLVKEQRDAESTLRLRVIGAENAPNLIGFLKQQGVVVLPPPDDAEAAIHDQSEAVILRIPDKYPDQWVHGEPAVVELLHDASRRNADTPTYRARMLIDAYSRQMGALRLLARGVAPKEPQPVAIADRDLSTPQGRASVLLAMMPYFLVLSIFIGGMYLAIDATAGERERQSLEPLLLNPVGRTEIVIGKLCAVSIYSALSAAVSIAAFAISMRFVPTTDLGFDLRLSLRQALLIGLVIVPLAPLAASLQTLFAARTKTFREAQTHLQFMTLIPLIPSFLQIVNPAKPDAWMYQVPLFSQSTLIGELTRGESISFLQLAVSWGWTLLAVAVLGAIVIAAYRRERVVFG
jgi:sodium transport system permease protein